MEAVQLYLECLYWRMKRQVQPGQYVQYLKWYVNIQYLSESEEMLLSAHMNVCERVLLC